MRAIARVAACLFALHGILIAIGPSISARSAGDVGWGEALNEYCTTQRGDAHTSHDRHDHQKCVSCSIAGRCAPGLLAAILVDVLAMERSADDGPPLYPCDEPDRRPIGWASSWSARAPPAFS
jgi:hypothetical protein